MRKLLLIAVLLSGCTRQRMYSKQSVEYLDGEAFISTYVLLFPNGTKWAYLDYGIPESSKDSICKLRMSQADTFIENYLKPHQ